MGFPHAPQPLSKVRRIRNTVYITYPHADPRWVENFPHIAMYQAHLIHPDSLLIRIVAYDYDEVYNRIENDHELSENYIASVNASKRHRQENVDSFHDQLFQYFLLSFPFNMEVTDEGIPDHLSEQDFSETECVPICADFASFKHMRVWSAHVTSR